MDPELALETGPLRTSPRTQVTATALAIGGFAMVIAGLLGFYVSRRNLVASPGSNWVPDEVTIPNAQLVMAMLTALMSSLTAQWSVWASRRNYQAHTYVGLGVTFLLGAAYLNMLMFSLNTMNIVIGQGEWQNLAFTATGYLIALIIGSMIYLGLMAFRSLGGDLGPDGSAPLESAVLFWHFTVVAYAAIVYVVYIVK